MSPGLFVSLPEVSVAQLVDIAVTCCAAPAAQQQTLLVRTHQAISGLPCGLLAALLPGFPDPDEFNGLMQADAYESAALRMLGSKLGYMASRSPEGVFLVTVCATGTEDLAFSAKTLALGLVAGLLTAVVVLDKGERDDGNRDELEQMN